MDAPGLRHSFVSLMSANGASIELIARVVRHTTTLYWMAGRRGSGWSALRRKSAGQADNVTALLKIGPASANLDL